MNDVEKTKAPYETPTVQNIEPVTINVVRGGGSQDDPTTWNDQEGQ